MVINGKTVVYVNGRPARVLSHRFNSEVRKYSTTTFTDASDKVLVPSSNMTWADVAAKVRAGKAVQARVAK